ncbi:MAG: 50S ribosomal protein L11 methyltransferase [Lunatimonas sp.]|uniref:50S ribosomal protein L11 methyltransferase n=1 Tax=Lunatimonas sp. TaxID=2060141 RepID=UPI00263BA3B2|nr:50S ribosomal protein L11 methyltransferase [Lunatimonas sp.]MCC5937368.1 50S ribosomal protein L11 methyltransferase [Lunatimonas sp.]
MDYIKYTISCSPSLGEILMAELAEIGFESFIETDTGIEAYIGEALLNADAFEQVVNRYKKQEPIAFEMEEMPRINWNEEWEKNYDPILVDEAIYVRASFHPKREDVSHEIIINPKMSFGTGHHATTYLMLKLLLGVPVADRRVLDAGSGTGILAIMAHRLGAAEVEAFDIDDWCVENGNENFQINGIDSINMGLGTIREVAPKGTFDIILANINKNVLLDEMGEYARLLSPSGRLLLSGFYESDIPDLLTCAATFKLTLQAQQSRNDWAALVLSN